PGAAPRGRRVLGHARTEALLLVRNGEQLLLALVIPAGLLVLGRLLGGRFGDLDTLAPSVLALAVWSTAFTSLGIATAFERRYGVLERLASTPLGKPGLLAGKAVSVVVVVLGQLAVLAVTALLLGWRPTPTGPSAAVALLLVALAGGAFAGAALLLAGRLRAESTLGVANLVYVLGVAAGGLVLPVDRYPAAVRPLVEALPTAALGEGLRAAATGAVLDWAPAVLLGWLALAALLAWKGFRWTS
ncbi:MAG: ABC transporter permease, partial [Actinomycetes bacterium]